MKAQAEFLFEVSSEVCNKVGGIYTVIKSKIELMQEYYENYFLIGPYYQDKAQVEFNEEEPPEFLKNSFANLESQNIHCHYGTWLIDGNPKVILIDYFEFEKNFKDKVKSEYWEWFKIETHQIGDFETLLMWSSAVGRLLKEIEKNLTNKKIVGHFHEFLAGPGLLYLKANNSSIKTVFTTHATILGRAIAGTGGDLYSILEKINPYEEAKKLGIIDKFTTEKACAINSDVFTTVSEITAFEAEKLLGRKPEVLVLNGLDINRFPTFEETSINHREYRDKIKEFIAYYFFPHYTFDLDETLIYFVVGRNEYKNKGLDILTKSLGKLNEKLKQENSKKTIVTFYWIPNATYGIKKELLENKDYYRHIKHFIDKHVNKIKNKIITDSIAGREINDKDIFPQDFNVELKKQIIHFKKNNNPLLTTHYMHDENNEPIVKGFKDANLFNREEDRVKVINYPIYLNGADGLIDLNYYDAIMGSHLGIFPSYYEPWGYTPLETAALGVPSITTNLAGFGRFIEDSSKTIKGGISVLKRHNKSDEEIILDFTKILYDFTLFKQRDRVSQKLIAKKLSELADWKELIKNYIIAHNSALEK